MKIFIVIFFILNIFLFSKEIVVVTDVWVDYSNEDGSGYYLDVLKEVFKDSDYELKIEFYPFARSVKLLETGYADICLGVYKSDLKNAIFSDVPAEIESVDLFILSENSNSIKNIKDIKNKTVTARIGYAFDDVLDFDFNYVEYPNLESMLKMLYKKRIDAILDYKQEVIPIIEKLHLENSITYLSAIFYNESFFAFSPENKDLKLYFDKNYFKLHQSGKLKEITLKDVGNLDSYPIF